MLKPAPLLPNLMYLESHSIKVPDTKNGVFLKKKYER